MKLDSPAQQLLRLEDFDRQISGFFERLDFPHGWTIQLARPIIGKREVLRVSLVLDLGPWITRVIDIPLWFAMTEEARRQWLIAVMTELLHALLQQNVVLRDDPPSDTNSTGTLLPIHLQ